MASMSELDVAGLELEHVEENVESLFEREETFFSDVEKSDAVQVSARDMRVPLEMRPGGKPGHFNPEGGDLGLGGGPVYDKAVIHVEHLKFAVQYTKLSDWATDSKEKAVLQNVRTLVAKGMDSFRRFFETLLMGDGTGVIATIGTVTAGGGTGGGDRIVANSDGFRAKLIQFGMDVNVFNSALSTCRTVGAERAVVFNDPENFTFDISNPTVVGIVNGDKVVVSGLQTASPVSLLGVKYHYSNASSGTWLGFNRATNPEIRASAVDASSSNLALSFARRAVNKTGDRVGVKARTKFAAWMHPAQVQAYESLGQVAISIHKQAKDEGLNLYFARDGMQLAGCQVMESFFWDRTRIDFVDKSIWRYCQMKQLGFFETGGQRIFPLRGASGGIAAADLFYFVCSRNYFINNPAKAVSVINLAVPTGY